MGNDQDFLFKNECYKIVGACMEVHKVLGCGFLESVYQEALAIELQQQGIPFEREKEFDITYKSLILPKTYKVDFLCYEHIIVELKALTQLTADNTAQIINYLKASNLKVGLLINFGAPSLQHQRFRL
ncbi:MAG: GxxExxY protein [Candidatus Cloacimonadota bacterium]|jgi:GxxExxY protein|nr:GxxExxY protein [Candidatus Cloacimonadota bacterium]NMD12557.1 GxxExxY protein [Candidatus Cloacimonadota bacterium]